MLWQYDIRVVVMLTNVVEGGGMSCLKCNMYWPEAVGVTKRFGDIEVQLFDKSEVHSHHTKKYVLQHTVLGTELHSAKAGRDPQRTWPVL